MPKIINRYKSIVRFLESVATVYPVGTSPKKINFPYITYDIREDGETFGDNLLSITICSNKTSTIEVLELSDKISSLIGEGVKLPILNETGCLYLTKGSPFSQLEIDKETDYKIIYMNVDYKAFI